MVVFFRAVTIATGESDFVAATYVTGYITTYFSERPYDLAEALSRYDDCAPLLTGFFSSVELGQPIFINCSFSSKALLLFIYKFKSIDLKCE